MRPRADFAHPVISDHWELRCMSRYADQVFILKRDPKCSSKLGTQLSTRFIRDERVSRPCLPRPGHRTRTCSVEVRYATTRPLGLKFKTTIANVFALKENIFNLMHDLENALAIRDIEYPRCLDNPEQRVFDDMLRCRP
ncbi:hypothetical protein TNCV_780761 [Trichonephila clavipes]|nr:hypothetical protein TNCV_780761 [Trichonephila clavipes]